MIDGFYPWPTAELLRQLETDDLLWSICGGRRSDCEGFDTREHLLEVLAGKVVRERYPHATLAERQAARQLFGIPAHSFLARSRPDLVLSLDGHCHVLEVKSSKIGDNRSQCVLGRTFREYLVAQGHDGPPPREVEQDLIKMELLYAMDSSIATGTLMMVDGYMGQGLKWSRVFADANLFAETMRTHGMKSAASRLVAATEIRRLSTPRATADVILCRVVTRNRTGPL